MAGLVVVVTVTVVPCHQVKFGVACVAGSGSSRGILIDDYIHP